MSFSKTNKLMDRLEQLVDNAIDGKTIETSFDETKVSALETKLSRYLAMSQTSRQQMDEEKRRISQLISDISHQTKTPIANILLYTQLLEESNANENDSSCIKALITQAEKLNFLIAALMKTSRLETGIISVSPNPQQVQPLFDNVLTEIEAKRTAKNITITCCQTQALAIFDFKWTAEALYNIVDNAIKYTALGGSVTISVVPYQLFCRIDVRDTGIGIGQDDITRIFTRFYRSPAVSDGEGVGIGLYLAREIISIEGGYIKVSSQLGKGSTFSIFLPL